MTRGKPLRKGLIFGLVKENTGFLMKKTSKQSLGNIKICVILRIDDTDISCQQKTLNITNC